MLLLGVLQAQAAGGGFSPRIAGYFAGGFTSIEVAFVNKFEFSTDSRTTLATGLSVARTPGNGTSNPDVAGYVNGGFDGSIYVATVDKYTFPADSRSTLATGLSAGVSGGFGLSNSAVAGYSAGGFPSRSTVDKFAFPSDSRTTLATGLSSSRQGGFSASNDGVAGYALTGTTTSNLSGLTTASDKFAFPSDTRSTLTYPAAIVGGASMSHWGNAGYFAGGNTGTRQSTIRKIAFATDSFSLLAATINAATSNVQGMENPTVAGYTGGGLTGSGLISTVNKLDYATESSSTLSIGLSEPNRDNSGFRN